MLAGGSAFAAGGAEEAADYFPAGGTGRIV